MTEPDAPLPPAAPTVEVEPSGTIRLRGTIVRADVADLCARAARAVAAAGHGPDVRCDVAAVDATAIPTVEVLARLALTARRADRTMRLEHASPELLDLLALCGLVGAIRPARDRRTGARAPTRADLDRAQTGIPD